MLAVGGEQVGLVAVRDIAAKPIQLTWVIGVWAGGMPEGPVRGAPAFSTEPAAACWRDKLALISSYMF